MTEEGTGSKAAEIAAQYVESIVAAAETSADELTNEAIRQAEEIRAKGREEAKEELDAARKQAVELGQDARREAARHIEEAEKEAKQLREQTRRQVEGRVSAAEKAAGEVLEEAKVLSSGLRQLGSSLQNQGERILRDVQAAHKRMQADLRVGPPDDDLPASPVRTASRAASGSAGSSSATPDERAALERAAAELRGSDRPSRRGRANPFDDLDVPSWVER
jgi:flagellar biosynthesis/type III secretory pathway protein FliH